MRALPDCDELFQRFFDRWYDDDDRDRKGFQHTRPDLLTSAAYRDATAASLSPLTPKCQVQILGQIETMTRAAAADFARALNLHGEMDLAWVETVDAHYDTTRIAELIESSDPEDFSNNYLVTCCEFGALLGHVMKGLQPRLFWCPDWPYWESSLIDPVSGNSIPVFHWAIKKMSAEGWEDGFAEKVGAALEFLDRPRA